MSYRIFQLCTKVNVDGVLTCFRTGTNITVRIPVPKATVSVSHEALGPGQVTELRLADKVYTWKIKKIDGGDEQILLLKVVIISSVVFPVCGL